ncbi:MAG: hypothetical protein LUG24_09060 [Clostridiales bacterium]|nr:hypothetical protein [Clostridiales bacterium]
MKKLTALTILLVFVFSAVIYADGDIKALVSRKVYEYDIGDGIRLYQNSDGRWGAYGSGFKVTAKYYLPCAEAADCHAFDDTFVLAANENTAIYAQEPENTYYVFNGEGKIIKTLTYSIYDIWEEAPGGHTFGYVEAKSYSGSNLVFKGLPSEINYGSLVCREFIKRLYSEKTEGSYLGIEICENGEFKAIEGEVGKEETWRLCILNPDGSFKKYYRG